MNGLPRSNFRSKASTEPVVGSDRLIRLPVVMRKVGLKRTAIYERMRRGCFPKSRSLGRRRTFWLETEVDEWIRSVIDAADR